MTETVPTNQFQQILFCTDFSANADRAFGYAVNAARRHTDGTLHLLHVIPEPPAQFWKGYIYEVDDDVDARAKREIDAKLAETYLPRVPEDMTLVIAMRIGEAGQKILEYVDEHQIDLVIIGRQGTGKVGKLLFGNVTERVVRRAPCPVMVIPPPR